MKLRLEQKEINIESTVTVSDLMDSISNYLHEDEIIDLILELYYKLNAKNKTRLKTEIKRLDGKYERSNF